MSGGAIPNDRGEAPRDLATEALLELLAIRSVIGEEAELAGHVEARLRRRLPDVRRHGNGIVGFGPRRGRPLVALVGHLDTVLPAPDDPNPPRIEGGRAFGLGASDMKGAIARDLALLEELDLAALPYDLAFAYYDREEGPIVSNGLRPLYEATPELARADLAICGEPTGNAVQLGALGTMHLRFVFHGKAAHSARPWQGENAIHKAAPLLAALAAAAPRDVAVDGLVFREVASATTASGGRSRNVVPDRFEVNLNVRFAPGTDPKEIERRLAAHAPGAERAVVDLAPAAPPRRSHPLVERLITATAAPVEPKQAWTDVAQLSAWGLAAVNFGPGEQDQAHQRGESISLASLARGRALLRSFLATA